MKVSLGKAKRKFVYDVKFGRRQIKRIMYGGKQIWPDETSRIRKLFLDMSVLQGSPLNAYWLHGLSTVSGGSNGKQYMKLRAGDRDYLLQTTYGSWKLATYSGDTIDFGVNGPFRGTVREGDTVTVRVVVPSRMIPHFNFLEERAGYAYGQNPARVTFGLPILNGCVWTFAGWKGEKKENPWNMLQVWGQHTGRMYFNGHVNTSGGGSRPCMMFIGMKNTTDGDYPVEMSLSWGGNTAGIGYIVYPAFYVTVSFKVVGLEYTRVQVQP